MKMIHKCCEIAKSYLRYDRDRSTWYIGFCAPYTPVTVQFCSWCGLRLPLLDRSQIAISIGDYVVKTKNGELRVLPREANGHDGIQYAEVTDVLIGRIAQLGECFEDHWVTIQPKLQWPYKMAKIKIIQSVIIGGEQLSVIMGVTSENAEIVAHWIDQHVGETVTYQNTYLSLVGVDGLLEHLGVVEPV